MSESSLSDITECGDFQAEYEGSIPFTRSNARKESSPVIRICS